MFKAPIKNFLGAVKQFPGYKTKRKIVVIQSDDWGSIRMPSLRAFEALKSRGYAVERDVYSLYDTLADEADINHLVETLLSVKDQAGRNPVFTANFVTGNPDFQKIEASGFSQYYFEPFEQTLKHYPNHNKSFELWKKGISEGLIEPQFHGREHLHVELWMKALKENSPSARDAFGQKTFAINSSETFGLRQNYLAAFDYNSEIQKSNVLSVVADGMVKFSDMFGQPSRSLIAPCYTWGESLEKLSSKQGIAFLQGIVIQKQPRGEKWEQGYRKYWHYTGKSNRSGQYHLIRNCFFEPSHSVQTWGADSCLKKIQQSFMMRKPAIISAHRVNFIGHLHKKNREVNLKAFKYLLNSIVQKWPEVEFLSTTELGDLIKDKTAK